MPSTYTVVSAAKKADKPDKGYGPMQDIVLKLRNQQGTERDSITWYTSAKTEVPAPGAQLVGDVEQGKFGLQFRKPKQGGGSGGSSGKYEADPKKQAAIAMEACQKAAVEIVRFSKEQGMDPAAVEKLVMETALTLYGQVQDAMREAS